MHQITLKQSAIDQLINDPDIQQWQKSKLASIVPFLGYYRRSYSTSRDGVVTEHGDGFMLTAIDPRNADETGAIVIRPVVLADNLDILVGGDELTISRNFSIDWSKKFTYEPATDP